LLKKKFIEAVVAEDIGRGDLFSRVSNSKEIESFILAKSDGIFGGEEYIEELALTFGLELEWNIRDAKAFKRGDILLRVRGDSNKILSLERSILNIALHASSIATLTRKYVDKISPYGVKLLDTRKTRPLLREFEKYAVRCGGGINHRMGLDDCLMLKDTHLSTIDNLKDYIKKIRTKIPFTSKIEIECESFEMAKEAMEAGADIIMCDNMTTAQIRRVVEYRDLNYPHILLEASGNITLDTIEEFAKTRVDAISTGAIIHQANWIDLSMKIKE